MLLKYNRGQLKREVRASWLTVVSALVLVLLALGGVIGKDPSILAVWIVFFIVVLSAVGLMFFRVHLLHVSYYAVSHLSERLGVPDNRVLAYIRRLVTEFSSVSTVFMTKYGRLPVLNQAVLYLLDNEEASHLYICHLYQEEAAIPAKLLRHVSVLDQQYPQLTIEVVLVKVSRSTAAPPCIVPSPCCLVHDSPSPFVSRCACRVSSMPRRSTG